MQYVMSQYNRHRYNIRISVENTYKYIIIRHADVRNVSKKEFS